MASSSSSSSVDSDWEYIMCKICDEDSGFSKNMNSDAHGVAVCDDCWEKIKSWKDTKELKECKRLAAKQRREQADKESSARWRERETKKAKKEATPVVN